VQPAIGLGLSLRATGYAVRVIAGESFRSMIEGHGLEAASSRVDMEAVMTSDAGIAWVEQGHRPTRQLRLMADLLEGVAPRLIEDAWDASQDADVLVSSFTSDTYALAIGERLDIPVVSVPMQPAMVATRDGRAVPNAPLPGRVSRMNEWFGKLFIEPFPWRLYGDHVNVFRRRIGLAEQTGRENVAARRRMTVAHAISPHVMPRPADWPATYHVTGYCFVRQGAEWDPPAGLTAFIEAGDPPVCIGFGSMTRRDPGGTTRLIQDAVRAAGVRAVLLSGWGGTSSVDATGDDLFVLDAAPHDWLFSRVSAVVHHGGAGTTAAASAAGMPHVVVPHMADQPYWGRRLQALGVAQQPLPRHKLTSAELAAAIVRVVSDDSMRERARALAARINAEDGPMAAAMVIDGIANGRGDSRSIDPAG